MSYEREAAIPSWIPVAMRSQLDLEELAPFSPEMLRERRQLEDELGINVAAYRAHACGRPNGLCIVYETATLGEAEVTRLKEAEAAVPGVVFVGFRKPLVRRAM